MHMNIPRLNDAHVGCPILQSTQVAFSARREIDRISFFGSITDNRRGGEEEERDGLEEEGGDEEEKGGE